MGNAQQIEEAVKATPVAQYINDADLKKFCSWLQVRKYEHGRFIYQAGKQNAASAPQAPRLSHSLRHALSSPLVVCLGDKCREFFIVMSGEVEIRTAYPDNSLVTTKRAGQYFGLSGVDSDTGQHYLSAIVHTGSGAPQDVICLVLPERKKDKMLAGVKITTDPFKRLMVLGILGWEPHKFLARNKFLREVRDEKAFGQVGCMVNCMALKGNTRHDTIQRRPFCRGLRMR
jgi:hypothetical protein